MKKSTIILLICFGCVVLIIMVAIAIIPGIMAGKQYNIQTNHPAEQPRTTWSTENGDVKFYANGNIGHGTMQSSDGPIQIAIVMSPLVSEIRIYHEEEYQQMTGSQSMGFGFAQGHGTVCNNDKFVIEITAADECFEVGEKLVFYKMDN